MTFNIQFTFVNFHSKINVLFFSFMGEGTGSIEEQPAATSAAKDESSFSLPTLSLFPKRFDDSQDTQDDLRNASDLPNGHNNPDAVDIAPR